MLSQFRAFRQWFCHAALSGVLLVSSARAQGPDPGVPATYRQLVAEALREFGAQHYAESLGLFQRAHQMWPNARTLRGLGNVSFELRHYRAAIAYFDESARSNVQPLEPGMRAAIEELTQRARGQLTYVVLRVDPESAHVLVDGSLQLVDAAKPLELDPGEHVVDVRAPGYAAQRQTYALQASEQATWSIRLQALPQHGALITHPSPAAPSAQTVARSEAVQLGPHLRLDRSDKPSWLLPAGLSVAFIGAVSAGIGGGFLAASFVSGDRYSAADSGDARRYLVRWSNARDQAFLFTGVGSALLSVGGASIGEFMPMRDRRWASPALLAVGLGVLAAGVAMYASNSCSPGTQTFQVCVADVHRQDVGSFVATLSAPLITIPVVHAVEWLFSSK
ncbi:MAG: hypothetical protein RL701_4820 [Pseudomonadota bacterium]|jgi:hypothetical protein